MDSTEYSTREKAKLILSAEGLPKQMSARTKLWWDFIRSPEWIPKV